MALPIWLFSPGVRNLTVGFADNALYLAAVHIRAEGVFSSGCLLSGAIGRWMSTCGRDYALWSPFLGRGAHWKDGNEIVAGSASTWFSVCGR